MTQRSSPNDNGNTATALRGPAFSPRVSLDELQRTTKQARAWLPGARPSHEARSGHVFFWAIDGRFGSIDVPMGQHAILGRHGCADACLDGDPELSLRQWLVISTMNEARVPVLRIIDLRGTLPFFLQDDIPRRSLVVEGPIVVRLGRYVVGAVPRGELDAFLEQPGIPSCVVSAVAGPRPFGTSSVLTLPSATSLSDLADLARRHAPGATRIEVRRRDGDGDVMTLTDAELSWGVLVGRSDRCVDGGIRAALTAQISRSHLLLLRERDITWAYDLASRNGTTIEGQLVRRAALADQGARLQLGGRSGVSLTLTRTSQAQAAATPEPPSYLVH